MRKKSCTPCTLPKGWGWNMSTFSWFKGKNYCYCSNKNFKRLMETKMQITTSTFIAITVSMVSQTAPSKRHAPYYHVHGSKRTEIPTEENNCLGYTDLSKLFRVSILETFQRDNMVASPIQIIYHQIGLTHIVWLHLQNHRYYSRYHLKYVTNWGSDAINTFIGHIL